jgi:hypothetical protein
MASKRRPKLEALFLLAYHIINFQALAELLKTLTNNIALPYNDIRYILIHKTFALTNKRKAT